MSVKKPEKWGAQTKNLTEKQQSKAKRIVGGGRTENVKASELKAAKDTTLDIGQTKWTTAKDRGGKGRGGLLTDASGKALTGTVTLASGEKASYVRGKRIGVGPKAGSTRTTPSKPTPPATSRGVVTKAQSDRAKQQINERAASAKSGASKRGLDAWGKRYAGQAPAKPKAGDKWIKIVGGRPTPMVYNGSRWILGTTYKGAKAQQPYKKGYEGGSWTTSKSKNPNQKSNPLGTTSYTGYKNKVK